MTNKPYPFEMKDVEPEEAKQMKLFSGELGGFIRVGPKGYILTQRFKEMASDIYNMEIRANDHFVVTYARSGTTWTQELVWMIANNLDYETARSVPITTRFPFLEFAMMIHPELTKQFLEKNKGNAQKQKGIQEISQCQVSQIAVAPSPRFIKTHLPISLLPPNLLDAKVVYVARDPRDVVVSFYYLCSSMLFMGCDGDFKSFWNLFIKDLHYWAPFFDHLKEAWEKRHQPNLLFLFYEELQKDLGAVVRRVSKFLGKQYNDEEVTRLCEHLDFKNFKNNASVSHNQMKDLGLMKSDTAFL